MMSRIARKFAIIGLVWSLIFTLFAIGPAKPVSALDEYDGLRTKWFEMLTGGTSYDPADPDFAGIITRITTNAQTNWDSLNKAPGRTYLWSDLTSTTDSSIIGANYNRIKDMALAYRTYGSSLYNNTALRDDAIQALDWMYVNKYNETTTMYHNWWFWEIGGPLALNDCTVLLYDNLTATQRTNYMNAIEHFNPTVNGTGANRVWDATIISLRGVIVKDSAKIAAARDGLSPVFPYVTTGDGYYKDGSMIMHTGYPYTGGYGDDLLNDIANVMYLLNGSTWQVTDPNKSNLFRWVYDSYEPLVYKGSMMDMSRGRVISRFHAEDHVIGYKIAKAVIRVSQFAPSGDAAAYKRMVKEWLLSDTYYSFYTKASLNYAVLAKGILADSSIVRRGELVKNVQFANMARVVHLRSNFGFAVSMHSNRIYNYESINDENLRGWHTADGMTYLYNTDLSQFSDNFWPTVNSYRLPGTTVLQNSTVAAGKYSDQSWAGGTELQGLYGVTGMSLHPYGQTLNAKKAWFMFDDEVVALGAGIASTDNKVVETVVENRKLNASGNNAITVNGTAKSASLGWSETMTGVSWAHLAGSVTGADIGYYFPGSATVKGLREARTDSWLSVNTSAGTDPAPYTRNYMSLWFDHGANPTNGSYAYVLLPGKTSAQVSAYAGSPNISVLENSSAAQGVKETTLNMTAVNFYNDAVKKVGVVQADKKSAVMVQENASDIQVSVADPTNAGTGTMNFEIHRSASDIVSADPAITVTQLSPIIKFSVNPAGLNGRSVKAKFALPEMFREAENYSAMSGAVVETTTDYGGGSDMGSLHNGDWLAYNNMDFGTGVERIDLRVASNNTGGSVELRLDSPTGTLIGSAATPYTGGWQNWTNLSVPVSGATGSHTLYLVFKKADTSGTCNLNWLQFSKPVVKTIEAESFSAKSANIAIETTSDTGGGQNIGGAYNNDWVEYNTVYFASGVSSISLRLASVRTGGTIELRLDSTAGSLIGTATVPNTGGWQTWTTVNVPVTGASGAHKLYLVFKRPDTAGVGNVNWIKYTIQ